MLCPAKPTHAMVQVFFLGNHFYLLVVGVVSLNLSTRLNNFRETFVREERTFVRDERTFVRDERTFVREYRTFVREERTFVRDEGMSHERRPLGPP